MRGGGGAGLANAERTERATVGRGDCAMISNGRWTGLRDKVDTARTRMTASEVRPNRSMCRLLVVGEDHRIARHPGVDPLALCRAAWRTYGCGRREGGSTVAMQLVRVLTGRFEKSWRRKVDEMVLAMLVTHHVAIEELPALYLSVGYYGWGMNGFVQACRRLRIDPGRCSLLESASVIARLKYPEPKRCTERRRLQIARRSEYLIARLEDHGGRN